MAVTLNDADPCGTAAALRQAYADLVGGSMAQVVTFRSGPGGVERSVTHTKGDPTMLLGLVREWEGKCATAAGTAKPRRFAFRTGGRF